MSIILENLQIMKKKINAQKVLVLFTVLLIGLTSCHKPEDINTDVDNRSDIAFTVNNNSDDLNKRMTIVREPIVDNNSLKTLDVGGDCFDYTWYLVAQLDALELGDEPLSATDVRILGNYAYVTYHRQGAEIGGGLEIIDISDPTNPFSISTAVFDDADINTLAVDSESRVFLAGSSRKGAILRQVYTTDGHIGPNSPADIKLSDAYVDGTVPPNANGIALSDDYIYISAGNRSGGTFQLDRQTLDFVDNEEYSDAKHVALNGGSAGAYQLTLVAGDDAELKVHQVGTDRSLVNSWDLGVIKHQNVAEPYLGKATLSIREGENIAFIAMNSRGAKGINIETGEEVYSTPDDMLTIGNTHGLAVDEKFIYLANSDDGLFIGCLTEEGEIIEVQRWDLGETGASANMVQTDGDWVFVAKGGGGLKILRKVANGTYPAVCDWDETGAPTCTEETVLCEDLISDFLLTLPDGQDALDDHPEYFTNANREVVLTEEAEVSVTFVMEGAGYKNTFGYYTYNKEYPPTAVEDIKETMTIIFSNASDPVGGKGTLKEGDRVNLGSFEAGTVIGYFVIANGWNGTEVTEGLATYYSLPALNRLGTQQSIMLYSERCGSLITSFEDMHTSGGDRDFNDIVVKTTIDPMSAMDMTEVYKF